MSGNLPIKLITKLDGKLGNVLHLNGQGHSAKKKINATQTTFGTHNHHIRIYE